MIFIQFFLNSFNFFHFGPCCPNAFFLFVPYIFAFRLLNTRNPNEKFIVHRSVLSLSLAGEMIVRNADMRVHDIFITVCAGASGRGLSREKEQKKRSQVLSVEMVGCVRVHNFKYLEEMLNSNV